MHSPWGDALRTRDRWRAVSPASRNGSGRGGTRARCLFNRRSCPSRRTRCARLFFFSSRRQHTRCGRDWSSDVCSSDLVDHILLDLFGHIQFEGGRVADIELEYPMAFFLEPTRLTQNYATNFITYVVEFGGFEIVLDRKSVV